MKSNNRQRSKTTTMKERIGAYENNAATDFVVK